MWISWDFMGFHWISWDLFRYSGTSCTIFLRTWWWVKHRLLQVEPHCAQLLFAPAARIFPTDCPSWPGIKFRVEGSKNIKHGCVTNWWLFMYFMLSIMVFEWFSNCSSAATIWVVPREQMVLGSTKIATWPWESSFFRGTSNCSIAYLAGSVIVWDRIYVVFSQWLIAGIQSGWHVFPLHMLIGTFLSCLETWRFNEKAATSCLLMLKSCWHAKYWCYYPQ